jgi:hypothetical protein
VDVDVFTATKAIAPAAMKSAPARHIELVLDFIWPPMREGLGAEVNRTTAGEEWVG